MSDESLRYPVGRFVWAGPNTAEQRQQFVEELSALPGKLADLLRHQADEFVDTPYRPGGWTVRQVVHHIADSHMNSYIRFRLALTELQPTIKPYDEARWAELQDARTMPVEVSLQLIAALHDRWVALLRSLTDTDWARQFRHPDMGLVDLDKALALYAWHGRHHLAHIEVAMQQLRTP